MCTCKQWLLKNTLCIAVEAIDTSAMQMYTSTWCLLSSNLLCALDLFFSPSGTFCMLPGLSQPSGLCQAGYVCPAGSTSPNLPNVQQVLLTHSLCDCCDVPMYYRVQRMIHGPGAQQRRENDKYVFSAGELQQHPSLSAWSLLSRRIGLSAALPSGHPLLVPGAERGRGMCALSAGTVLRQARTGRAVGSSAMPCRVHSAMSLCEGFRFTTSSFLLIKWIYSLKTRRLFYALHLSQ